MADALGKLKNVSFFLKLDKMAIKCNNFNSTKTVLDKMVNALK